MDTTDTTTDYHAFASDLRAVAALLDVEAFDLPAPLYPWQGLRIDVVLGSPEAIDQAAKTLGVTAEHTDTGHHHATLVNGLVRVDFQHVDAAGMAAYSATPAYADTMPVVNPPLCDFCSEPITGVPVVNPDEASWLGTGAATYCSSECKDANNEARIQAAGGPS